MCVLHVGALYKGPSQVLHILTFCAYFCPRILYPSRSCTIHTNQTPGYNVAYVGNISFDVDAAAIEAFFGDCNVTKVRLHTDKDTGRSKGYAHVHFEDEAGLDRCATLGLVGWDCGGMGVLRMGLW